MKKTRAIAIVISILVFIVSMAIIILYFYERGENADLNERLRNQYIYQIMDAPEELNDNSYIHEDTGEIVSREMMPNMKMLYEENQDTSGWITIPGTKVDNVVVQGEDNDYYLKRSFELKKNQAGTIFVDEDCIVNPIQACDNLILYGHNQRDGTMFGSLSEYKKGLFVADNSIINYNTNYVSYKYKIIAAFVVKTDNDNNLFEYNLYTDFNSQESFDTWYDQITSRSLFSTDITSTIEDKYITLSTCSSEFTGARFVVIGQRINDEELLDNSSYYLNKNN